MTKTEAATGANPHIPFNAPDLDALMEAAGLDVIIASSKHNVQYLTGGYRFFFFDTMDALGISRYQNAVVYQKGKPENTAYIGCAMEAFEVENGKFWMPTVDLHAVSPAFAMHRAAHHIQRLGGVRSVGIEADFLPTSGHAALKEALGNVEIKDAFFALERLRAVKTPLEIGYLRQASECVVRAMQTAFKACKAGATKQAVIDTLKSAQVERGLQFDYCLMTAGLSFNRAPSGQVLATGDIVSIDSGANYQGYIGDLCRMGLVDAAPDSELIDLLGWIEHVQQATRALAMPGRPGGDILTQGDGMVAASPHSPYSDFAAHGMGLVSHEAPRLRHMAKNTASYPGTDADLPLEPGMVLSIETTMKHPKRGFIKLEDTLLVTANGHEALGDGARGWNASFP